MSQELTAGNNTAIPQSTNVKPSEKLPQANNRHVSTKQLQKTNRSGSGKPPLLSPRTEFILDWVLKVLAVASAILFGIWAPISYKATANGNADNNAAQEVLSRQMSYMSAQASVAVDKHGSAITALAEIQTQLADLRLLRAFEFCRGMAEQITACADLSSNVNINIVVSQFVPRPTLRTTTTRTSLPLSPTSGSAPESSSSGAVSKNLLAIILGAVFGAIVIMGFIIGFLAWRRRQKEVDAD
jgi:hypothetical protein